MNNAEDDTVLDENESTAAFTSNFATSSSEDDSYYRLLDPSSLIDIFYDAKDRFEQESLMDEDLIPIGLEPDDSVMLESVETCIRDSSSSRYRGNDDRSSTSCQQQQQQQPPYGGVPLEHAEAGSITASASCSTLSASIGHSNTQKSKPEDELPVRFLRAGKGDPVEGRRRYEATLKWRKENNIDTFLSDAWPHFELIKTHYPHFFHCKGKNGEPVFYEQPPKTDLRALRNGGISIEALLKHYAMVTEFQWQYVNREDCQKSIYIIDLAGIRMTDFVGECVDFVRRASEFTSQHYPERCGYVFIINVPGWFKMIWNVVKPMVDEVTLEKIYILRGKEETFNALSERIAIENIPQEYGGQSAFKLGESPEEELLRGLMKHNNEIAEGKPCCHGEACKYCHFTYARNY